MITADHAPLKLCSSLGFDPGALVSCSAGRAGSDEKRRPIANCSPIDGSRIGTVEEATAEEVELAISRAVRAFEEWRSVPAPVRGGLVGDLGALLRGRKEELAGLITLEVGKPIEESRGEVQEVLDICDFAVGLSRQLPGALLPSERRQHELSEAWEPLGPVGLITAFNFPAAIWGWNAMVALVCGVPVVWKPSEKAPLVAMACHALLEEVISTRPDAPPGLHAVVHGGGRCGRMLAEDPRLPVISATGSTVMGREVASTVARRLGRSILELGGNNALVVTPSADLELALRAVVFAAVGTSGQRCTSLRRLILHESIAQRFSELLDAAYSSLRVGNPQDRRNHVGPLIDPGALERMQESLTQARRSGADVRGGEPLHDGAPEGSAYVTPSIVAIDPDADLLRRELFAPVLFVSRYSDLSDAIRRVNDVPQGLSASIFTRDLGEAHTFMSSGGAVCGIVNVNVGTSGAEIGAAFGGEKDTGGGREAGSDAWKGYMRRVTRTVNYSDELPLSQGIRFGV